MLPTFIIVDLEAKGVVIKPLLYVHRFSTECSTRKNLRREFDVPSRLHIRFQAQLKLVLKANENEDHRRAIDSNVEWKRLAFSEFVAVASGSSREDTK